MEHMTNYLIKIFLSIYAQANIVKCVLPFIANEMSNRSKQVEPKTLK